MNKSREFETFWAAYPRKVGKFAAEKAFQKARARGVTMQDLIQGIERYIAHKPSYADFCHASTWLNQGRWLDEYETAPKPRLWTCPDDPPCPIGTTQWQCHQRAALEKAKRERQTA